MENLKGNFNEKEFKLWKRQTLEKIEKGDKSFKGGIDEKILDLCETINKIEDMFTLSSCSGRICLLNRSNFKKEENIWIFVSHNEVKENLEQDFFNNLYEFSEKKEKVENNSKIIEFRTEGPIIHICVNSFELASKLIEIGKKSGFNHAQIIGFRKKIVVELICDLNIICPIFENELLISEDYLKYLIKKSNNLLKEGWRRIDKLKKEISNLKNIIS